MTSPWPSDRRADQATGRIERGADQNVLLQALLAVRGLLDPADERYEAQRELSAAGVLAALETLVQVRCRVLGFILVSGV